MQDGKQGYHARSLGTATSSWTNHGLASRLETGGRRRCFLASRQAAAKGRGCRDQRAPRARSALHVWRAPRVRCRLAPHGHEQRSLEPREHVTTPSRCDTASASAWAREERAAAFPRHAAAGSRHTASPPANRRATRRTERRCFAPRDRNRGPSSSNASRHPHPPRPQQAGRGVEPGWPCDCARGTRPASASPSWNWLEGISCVTWAPSSWLPAPSKTRVALRLLPAQTPARSKKLRWTPC